MWNYAELYFVGTERNAGIEPDHNIGQAQCQEVKNTTAAEGKLVDAISSIKIIQIHKRILKFLKILNKYQ